MKSKIKSISFTSDGKPLLLFEMSNKEVLQYEKIFDDDVDIKIKKYSEHRSLNANAYAWKLMGLLAEAVRISKEEVYHKMLCRYGALKEDDNGNAMTISIRSNIDLSKADEYLYIHSSYIGKSTAGENDFSHYRLLKGSSEYDKAEMARFIDGIVQECENLEIPTIQQSEVDGMIEAWGKGFEKHSTKRA